VQEVEDLTAILYKLRARTVARIFEVNVDDVVDAAGMGLHDQNLCAHVDSLVNVMCYHDCLSKAVAKVDTFFESTNDLPLFFAMNMIFCSFAQDKGYCSYDYRHSVV